MIRCAWCGAQNYAIDMWCARCHQHLDWQPTRRRRRFRVVSVIAPVAAAAGVAMALALPVAGGFSGSIQLAIPSLPGTGNAQTARTSQGRVASASSQRSAGAPAAAAAPVDAAPPSNSAPPADTAAPAVSAPPLAAAPPALFKPAPAVQATGTDPTTAIDQFYQAVSAHRFDVAAALWSAQLKAVDPPTLYIDQRFADTQRIGVSSQRVLAADAGSALVYVDVVELIAGQSREWVGTWQLIQADGGWLLNSSNLQGE